MLTLQNEILEMIARGEPLHATMEILCQRIEARVPGVLCSVVAVDGNGLLRPVAGGRLPAALAKVVDGLPIGPKVGACGTAIYTNAPVNSRDIPHDPAWLIAREALAGSGLKACWSSPIRGTQGRVLGAFAFYYRRGRGPSQHEQKLVATCVHLSAIALERQERVLERERRALLDELTGLGNRAAFNALLRRMPCDATASWGILAIDLDNLKAVNDTYGHAAGDRLLQHAGRLIAGAMAPDVTFRLGGDEFAVVVQSPEGLADLDGHVQKLLARLDQPFVNDGFALNPQASIGGALIGGDDRCPEDVHQRADHALYVAKGTGRGRFVRYWPGIGSPIHNRARLSRQLVAALREGRIGARYQPIVDLAQGHAVGAEAYCRLSDAFGNRISPAEAGLLQAEAPLMLEVTRCMLATALQDLVMFRQAAGRPMFMAVNIAPSDLRHDDFTALVAGSLAEAGVAPGDLVLDLDGAAAFDASEGADKALVLRKLEQLQAMGVRVALDDFGRSRAALTDLAHAPVDILKLAPEFATATLSGPRAQSVGTTLIAAAREAGMMVIAEGVETAEQHAGLMQMGCQWGQGYRFAPDMDQRDFLLWLHTPGPRLARRG